jgi:hypothetical protein
VKPCISHASDDRAAKWSVDVHGTCAQNTARKPKRRGSSVRSCGRSVRLQETPPSLLHVAVVARVPAVVSRRAIAVLAQHMLSNLGGGRGVIGGRLV